MVTTTHHSPSPDRLVLAALAAAAAPIPVYVLLLLRWTGAETQDPRRKAGLV